jgi:hypothetical protein
MLPKNKLRKEYLSKITVYDQGGHDLYHLGLPQFGHVDTVDYNQILGRNITPETHEIIATDLANLDECKFFY